MPKKLVKEKKVAKSTTKKEVSNVKKIKMLVTVVDRSKTLFYLDLLEQFLNKSARTPTKAKKESESV